MTFTINRFISPAAQKIDTAIRNKLLFALKQANVFGQKSVQELRQMQDSTSTAELIIMTYVNAKQYEQLQSVQDELSSGDGRTEQEFLDQAVHMYRYTTWILTKPLIEDYAVLLENVNETLVTYSILEKSDERIHDSIGDLLSCLLNYAQKCADKYDELRSMTDDEMTTYLAPYSIDLGTSGLWNKTYSADISNLKAQVTKLMNHLGSSNTYDEIVKFILSRDIGTFGSAYIPDISSPLFVSILPYSIKDDRIDGFWKKRRSESPQSGIPADLADVDDSEAQKLQASVLSSLSTNTLPQHRDHSIKRSLHKKSSGEADDDDEAQAFGLSFSATPSGRTQKKKTQKDKRRKGDESPHSSSSHQGPQVPDDTSYEPDSALASRAADMTKEYRNADPSDMSHDHMTRFSTNSEASTSLSRNQVRQTDWTFITKTRFGSTRYLVTYTRKSKKPIFSIVSQ